MEPIYKKELNPSFWQNNSFNSSIRRKILKIISDIIKDMDLNVPVTDIILTGSLANYTYNKFSDLDTHIVLDFSKINDDRDLVTDMLDGKRFVWNLRHNIFIRGHEIEIYFEDKNQPKVASSNRGIYSLLKNEWVNKPEYNPPEDIDIELLEKKTRFYTSLVDKMLSLVEQSNDKKEFKLVYNKAKKIKDKVMKVREEALKEKGEFALENLLFKRLRNNDTIEKLINVINMSYDKFFMESLQFNKIAFNFINK